MSTAVDSRVLEMRFDNKQFESGVSTTMSTLEKLKQKLNLSSASKGLENISSAAKNVNFSGMSNGIETVQAKFSALQIVGVTALANITNSAVNAGKSMVKALTIDPVTTGFQEYETQINAVQTILANTKSKGSTLEDVNKALDELNTYADKTIYNFTEMTRNIGTFTAAGVELDKSVTSIKGIANLAAVSGSTSQQASTAMYQLSQALAAGKVQLMDWNSVVNAGMGGEVFQTALKRTATQMGYNVDALIEKYGSFRESLTKGEWLTAEVLTETLTQLSGAYTEADLIAQGYTEKQAKEIVDLANTAVSAATEVKTFTQLWDTLKEAAQSGWTQTWELIIGDFEQAKELLTGISDFFGNVIGNSANKRNKILEGALANNPFTKLAERIEKVTGATEAMTKATKDYGAIVDKVIGGEYGNGQSRWDKLTEEGYDWAHIQNLVNEKLGDGTRHATNYKEAQDDLNKTQKTTIEALVKMSDAQLKQLGFTKGEIKAFRELEEQSKKTGIPLKDLVKDLDQLNGRTLLINAFKNAGQGLVAICKAIKDAWREAFWGDASEEEIWAKKSERLYNIIAAIHKFSTYLKVSGETADKVKRTFKGLFAILNIISTIAGGGLKLAFTVLSKILGVFHMDILDVTAILGDMLVKFKEFLFDNKLVNKAFELIGNGLVKAAEAIKNFYDAFKNLPQVQKFVAKVKEEFEKLKNVDWSEVGKNVFEGLKNGFNAFIDLPIVQKIISKIKEEFESLKDIDLTEVGRNILEGLRNGLGDGVFNIVEKMIEIGTNIITAICDVLGIHSPSTVMIEIGKNIVEGLFNGIQNGISKIIDLVKNIGSKIAEAVGSISWDKVFAFGVSIALLVILKKLADTLEVLASPLEGFGELLEGAGKVMTSFSKVLNGIAWDFKAKAIQKFAIALGILVASIYVLSKISIPDLTKAVVAIGILAGILIGVSFAISKLNDSIIKIGDNDINISGFSLTIIAIGATLLLLAATVKMIGGMNPDEAKQGFIGLAGMIAAMGVFIVAVSKLTKRANLSNINKIGSMMLKLSIAMMLMVGVVKLIGTLSAEDMLKGAAFATGFALFVSILSLTAKGSNKEVTKIGSMILKLTIAMALMVGVVKLIGTLSAEEMLQGAAFAIAFGLFVAAMVHVTKIDNGQSIAKVGGLLLSLSTSMLLMASTIKLIASMSWGGLAKGLLGISALSAIMYALVKMVASIGPDAPKLAGTLLAMSVSIGILAMVAIMLSLINLAGLAKGITAVAMLGGVMTAMIWATRGANDVKGNLIIMTIAIGAMTAAVVALSFIDGTKLAGATAAISIMMGMFALIAKSAGTMGKLMAPLAIMTIAIGVLAGVLILISRLPIESTLAASASLSMLLLSMSASMLLVSKAGGAALGALIPLAAMTLVVAGLAAIIGMLAKYEVGSTLEIAKSLSLLLIALSGACLILSAVGMTGAAAFVGVAALVTLIAAVGGIMITLGALADYFPRMEEFLNKGLPILEKIGYGLGSFFGNIIGGFSAGITSGLPETATNLTTFMDNLQGFIDGAKGITEDSLTGVKNLAQMFALLAGANILESISKWITGGSSMDTFSTGLNSFADAIVSFSDKVTGHINEESVLAAANAGKLLAEMQSTIQGTGGVVQFFSGEKSLADFGSQLVAFGDAMVKFSNKVAGNIDEEAVTAASSAGNIMAEMQSKITPSDGVVQWFTGNKDMGAFGTQLVAFGDAIVKFSNKVAEGVNEEAVTAAANAGTVMATLQSKLTGTDGVIQWFTGNKDLAAFGTQLVAFGDAIVKFSNKVSGEGAVNEEAITAAANAGELMTTLQKKVTPNGGVLDFFTGSKDLATFGTQIKEFGSAISEFSKSVTGDNAINEEAANAAVNIGTMMASLQAAIPDDKWFDGKVSIDDFGAKIKRFGGYIADYGEEVADIDSVSISSSVTQAQRLVDIAKLVTDLEVDNIGKFKDVSKIGDGIKGYADKVKDIDAGIVASSVTSANKLKNLVNSLAGIDTSGISKFKVSSIGTAIKSYAASVSGINAGAVSNSVSAANKLKSLINSLSGIDTSGVGSFKTAVEQLGTVSIDKVVKAFNGSSGKLSNIGGKLIDSLVNGIKSKQASLTTVTTSMVSAMNKAITSKASIFTTAGITLVGKLATGMSSQRSKVTSAASSALSGATSGMRGHYSSFYSAGSYLASGFANGISANSYRAAAQARAMATAAKRAAESALGIASPSKVFYKIGNYTGLGFVKALSDYTSKAYSAGSEIADSARFGLSNAIGKVKDLIDGGMDTQPTIRPVLDLSNIESSAGVIGGMFANGPTVGVSANLNAISSMMNRRNQNGINSDVVSAINKLRKDLGNVGGSTTYHIDGITYDDGSNVSDAVRTLVRAAKMERRT